MLSILIPVYNQPVSQLVTSLVTQCKLLGIEHEIIVLEDGSDLYLIENASIALLEGVHYKALSENAGRAAIRNHLADVAQFQLLLFLDCDSLPVSDSFVANYLNNKQWAVVYGGTTYKRPANHAFLLHYQYGNQREALPFKNRIESPSASFRTNNFMIQKEIMREIRFDESLRQYGHEDTLFAIALQNAGIVITHIDNAVLHDGLEVAEEFLKKSKLALENAWMLTKTGTMPHSAVKVIDAYHKIRALPGGVWLLKTLSMLESSLLKNLCGKNPGLNQFDMLRLIWIQKIERT